ncbi:hypothetical protein ES703_119931 [subsurface metagenome]
MPTKLEVLLAQIDPSRTLDEVAARVNRARNSFRFGKALITDYEEYEELTGRFVAHIEAQVLRIRPMYDTGAQLYRGRATALLNQAYGSQGWKTAFEMVRTGLESGLRAVLDTLPRLWPWSMLATRSGPASMTTGKVSRPENAWLPRTSTWPSSAIFSRGS